KQLHVVGRSARSGGRVVLRNGAAQHDATATGKPSQRRLECLAANIVEEHVDPVGSVRSQLRPQIAGLVINSGVEPELLDQPATLLLAAGDADRPATLDPRYLPGDAADRPGRARDPDGLTGLGSADVEQPEVGGQAADAQDTQMYRGRREGRVH